jgi:cytochrome c-type biogenesis protein CcmE
MGSSHGWSGLPALVPVPGRSTGRGLLALILALAFTVPACDRIAIGADHIGSLLENPTSYQGKTVKVAGVVTNALQLPFVDTRLYTVRDGTGEIAVVTRGELPAVGQKVVARGTFSTVATFGTRSVGPHINLPR